MTATQLEVVDWSTNLFPRLRATWAQAQHGLAIAPTGRGKTVLMQELVKLRDSVVFFGTKSKDDEYDNLRRAGFTRIQDWPPHPALKKVMLWPRPMKTMREMRARQQTVFGRALDGVFANGKWTVVLDELHWMAQALRLYDDIAHLHHQGRSSKLTLLDGFQRPAFVPVIVYSSATHVFIWGTNSRDDLSKLKSVAKLDAYSSRELAAIMGGLTDYQFVYVNTRDNRPPVISEVSR